MYVFLRDFKLPTQIAYQVKLWSYEQALIDLNYRTLYSNLVRQLNISSAVKFLVKSVTSRQPTLAPVKGNGGDVYQKQKAFSS